MPCTEASGGLSVFLKASRPPDFSASPLTSIPVPVCTRYNQSAHKAEEPARHLKQPAVTITIVEPRLVALLI